MKQTVCCREIINKVIALMKEITEEQDGDVLDRICTPGSFEGEFDEVRIIFISWDFCDYTDSSEIIQ